MRDPNPRTPVVIESDWKLPAPVMRLGLSERSRTDTAMDARPYGGWSPARPGGTAILFLMLALALLPRTLWSASACDLNNDTRIDVIDVQLGLNQALGISTCTSADLSANGQCDIVDVQRLINAALGQECRVGPDASVNPPQGSGSQPWERSFTALRTHYVSVNGTGSGSIGSPESLAAAIAHCQAGDLHVLRGGTYTGDRTISCGGTSSNPIVWKGFIDSNGDPEKAQVDARWRLDGAWNWVWAMQFGNGAWEGSSGEGAISMRAAGTAVINTVVQRVRWATGVDSFAYGPSMVLYGLTAIDNGWDQQSTPSRHNLYTQNRFKTHGRKYIVQMTSLDTIAIPPSGNNRGVLTVNASGDAQVTESRTSGYTILDSTYQNGAAFMVTHTSNAGGPPQERNMIDNMWGDSLNSTNGLHIGSHGLARVEITNSLFRNSTIRFNRYWGAGDQCWPYNNVARFQNNEVYDPIKGVAAAVWTDRYNSGCSLTGHGSARIRDDDVWDNNTYGRTSGKVAFDLSCGGVQHGAANTLAEWRSRTDACRATAGATAFDASSTEVTTPTKDRVECFSNFYDPNWGKCRAIDFDRNGSITIPAAEVQKIVGNGKTYKVRNARNFHGTPLKSGTYTTGAGISSIPVPSDAVNGVLLVWITSQP